MGLFLLKDTWANLSVASIVTQNPILVRVSKYSALWNLLNDDGMLPYNTQGLPRYILVTHWYHLPYSFLSFMSALCSVQCCFGGVLSFVAICGWLAFVWKAAGWRWYSAFGVMGDEPQGGFPARVYGTRPRGSTEPCQAAGKLRPAQPGASLPFSGMLPAFCINFPGPPRLFPKTNRAHTQQRTAGIAALGAKGWGLGFGSFFWMLSPSPRQPAGAGQCAAPQRPPGPDPGSGPASAAPVGPTFLLPAPPGESQLALEESASWQRSSAFYTRAQK